MRFFFKRYKQLSVLFLVLATSGLSAQSSLVVNITGIHTSKGEILYSLYDHPDGFPDQPSKAFRIGSVPVTGTSLSLTIGSLPAGTYALSVIHDSNGNGKLDMNKVGLPIEGIGFSNNVMGAFGPPKFQRARFTIQPGKNEIPIRLRLDK